MNYIRFIRKRVNVIVYFGNKPNTDWDMVKVCQSMKETHKFRFDGATKEWYLTFRMDDFDPVLDNISSYDNLLGYFDNTQREKFTTFLKVKNRKYYEQIQGEKEESKKRTQKYLNRIIEYHHLNLYTHQKEDVQILSKNTSTILGNEMGTGKTRSSVVYSEIQDFKKILIVCPASLKLNWRKEILMVNPSADICVLPEESPMPYTKYYIINYDILIKEFTFEKDKIKKNKIRVNLKEKSIFNKIKFDAMFIDEAHYIKNDSKRTRATLHFVDYIPHIIPISGTPIKSKVKDIYNLLLAIKHPLTKKGYFPFAQRYCGAYYNGFGWTYDGASNLEELYEHLKPYMIRKLKDECLDLPPKIITEVYVELSKEGQKEYETAFEDYLDFVRNEKLEGEDEVTKNIVIRNIEYAEHLVKLNLLKQICSRDKLPLIYERIEDLLEEDEDRKIIVFSQYTDIIAKLYTRFKDKAVKLTGATTLEDRQKAIEEFQNNSNIRVFIGNTIAGGVGITLTKADVVIMADLLWTPADHVQAEDRAHRIGQHASVNVLYFLVKDSIEEDIFKLIQKKREIINKVIDNIDSVDENQKVNMLRTIIDNLNKKYNKK